MSGNDLLTVDNIITTALAGAPQSMSQILAGEPGPQPELKARAKETLPSLPKEILDQGVGQRMTTDAGDVADLMILLMGDLPKPLQKIVSLGMIGWLCFWIQFGFALGRAYEREESA